MLQPLQIIRLGIENCFSTMMSELNIEATCNLMVINSFRKHRSDPSAAYYLVHELNGVEKDASSYRASCSKQNNLSVSQALTAGV